MQGIVGMLLANDNTAESLNGLGALKGAPCTIYNIEEIYDEVDPTVVIGTKITFEWTGNDGTKLYRDFNVMNGKNGRDGKDGAFAGDGDDPEIPEDEILDICKL